METRTTERGGGERRRVEFFAPLSPPTTTHNDLVVRSRRQKGKWTSYIGKSENLVAAEATWEAHLAAHAPEEPLHGAMRAEARICFPTGGAHEQGSPMTACPDLDNVEKTLWDVLARLKYYDDDRRIVDKRTCKMWSDPAGIYLMIEEI